jgi:hypothetical protein
MLEEIEVTRRQLMGMGATADWCQRHMRGRGRLPLSKVIECAPPYFSITRFLSNFTGEVVYSSGEIRWHLNGNLHREGGPAIEYANGTKEWWLKGRRHREGAPAIEYAEGSKSWFLNDKIHREDGPAYEGSDGTREWWLNGRRHREYGPAIEYSSGRKEWWLNDRRLTEKDYRSAIEREGVDP